MMAEFKYAEPKHIKLHFKSLHSWTCQWNIHSFFFQTYLFFLFVLKNRFLCSLLTVVISIHRPTQISNLINLYGFQENLLYCKFWSLPFYTIISCLCILHIDYLCVLSCLSAVLEELVNSGRLKGSVVGGRQDKAIYIPDIYSKAQSTWVDSFLKQNGYLGVFILNDKAKAWLRF